MWLEQIVSLWLLPQFHLSFLLRFLKLTMFCSFAPSWLSHLTSNFCQAVKKNDKKICNRISWLWHTDSDLFFLAKSIWEDVAKLCFVRFKPLTWRIFVSSVADLHWFYCSVFCNLVAIKPENVEPAALSECWTASLYQPLMN